MLQRVITQGRTTIATDREAVGRCLGIAEEEPDRRRIGRRFFNRSPEIVAPQMLGKVLRHKFNGKWLSGRVTEVEAYLGLNDPASHAYNGRTERNRVLFGPPGMAYVYLIYGMYWCLNVSCLPEGQPGGVLFRAIEPLEGAKTMARLRSLPTGSSASRISGGPGRLCQALGITRKINGVDMTRSDSLLRFVDDGHTAPEFEVTARIGIQKAAHLPLRFVVSPYRAASGIDTGSQMNRNQRGGP